MAVTPTDGEENGVTRRGVVAIDNTLPTCSSATVVLVEDEVYPMGASELGFADADADALGGFQPETAPGSGAVMAGEVAVLPGEGLSSLELENLRYVPGANEYGDPNPYASFTFKVADDEGRSTGSCTLTFDVTSVNDLPIITVTQDPFVMNEDAVLSDEVVAVDYDADILTYALVSDATQGSVVLDSTTGDFTYTPNEHANGLTVSRFQSQTALARRSFKLMLFPLPQLMTLL